MCVSYNECGDILNISVAFWLHVELRVNTLSSVVMCLCIHRRRSSEIAFCGKNKFRGTVFDLSLYFRTTQMS